MRRRQAWLFILLVVLSLSSYYGVSHYVVSSVVVQGRSMVPTLEDGDRCFLDRWTLQRRDPQRGDLVVIRDPGHEDYAVKRIVGLPGERVIVKEGLVYVDGHILPEPYLSPGVKTLSPESNQQTFFLGADQYFVLGDNRPFSEDSRFYGPLARPSIIGLITR